MPLMRTCIRTFFKRAVKILKLLKKKLFFISLGLKSKIVNDGYGAVRLFIMMLAHVPSLKHLDIFAKIASDTSLVGVFQKTKSGA